MSPGYFLLLLLLLLLLFLGAGRAGINASSLSQQSRPSSKAPHAYGIRETAALVSVSARSSSAHGIPCDSEPGDLLCPVTCFRPDPVCGEDGVTYWCGCRDARCSGVHIAHSGYCGIHSAGSVYKASQALLLVHTLWLFILGLTCILGLI